MSKLVWVVLCVLVGCATSEVRNTPRPPEAIRVPEEVLRDPQQRQLVTEQLRRQYQHQRTPELRDALSAAGFTPKEVDYIAGPAPSTTVTSTTPPPRADPM
jgi:hypothetical protein